MPDKRQNILQAQIACKPDNIPVILRLLLQWVMWSYSPRDGGKPSKILWVPRPDGGIADVDTHTTWGTYDEALSSLDTEKYDGMGLVLTPEDQIVVVAID